MNLETVTKCHQQKWVQCCCCVCTLVFGTAHQLDPAAGKDLETSQVSVRVVGGWERRRKEWTSKRASEQDWAMRSSDCALLCHLWEEREGEHPCSHNPRQQQPLLKSPSAFMNNLSGSFSLKGHAQLCPPVVSCHCTDWWKSSLSVNAKAEPQRYGHWLLADAFLHFERYSKRYIPLLPRAVFVSHIKIYLFVAYHSRDASDKEINLVRGVLGSKPISPPIEESYLI